MATKCETKRKAWKKVSGNFISKSTHFIKVRKKRPKTETGGFYHHPTLLLQTRFSKPDSVVAYSDLTGAQGRNQVSKPLPQFPVSAPPIQLLRPSTLSLHSLTLHTWCSEKSQRLHLQNTSRLGHISPSPGPPLRLSNSYQLLSGVTH